MLVSVIMSVYDGDNIDYLREAIESILHQSYKEIEFVIVMDGIKKKDLRKVIYHYKETNNNIVVVELSENKGLAYALNIGIKHAKGQYLVRMDADDISHPNRVEKLVNWMNTNPIIDIAGSFIEEFDTDFKSRKIVKYPLNHSEMKNLFAKRNPLAHSSVIFRRSFFIKAGFYPNFSLLNEDTLLWLSGFKNGCVFSNVPEVLISVRFNKKAALRRNRIKKAFSDFIDRIRIIIDLNASFSNIFYALCTFIVQSLPYNLYIYLRSKIIKILNDKIFSNFI